MGNSWVDGERGGGLIMITHPTPLSLLPSQIVGFKNQHGVFSSLVYSGARSDSFIIELVAAVREPFEEQEGAA